MNTISGTTEQIENSYEVISKSYPEKVGWVSTYSKNRIEVGRVLADTSLQCTAQLNDIRGREEGFIPADLVGASTSEAPFTSMRVAFMAAGMNPSS